MYYFINNKFIHSSKAKISFHDSGFLFGDGLFETMRFDNSKIFSINNHLNRLMKGLEIIDLKINKSKNELTKILYNVINKNSAKDGIIRLMITRGSSNKIDEDYKVPSIYISIKNFYEIPEKPVKIIYFNEISVSYLSLFTGSLFTFIMYPILWFPFELFRRLLKAG